MKKTHISNSPEIETVYNLTDATEIIVNRAAKVTRRLLLDAFKEFTQSPIFIQKIVGVFLVIISLVAIQYYRKFNINEPLWGFFVIMLCGIYLVFENEHRKK